MNYSGSSLKAVDHPLSWWMNDAGWLAGVHGCTPANRAWLWRSNGGLSDVPLRAQPERPPSKTGLGQARKLQPRQLQHQPSNLKAGQKSDGNPMSSQR
jgi:hypothetical protein